MGKKEERKRMEVRKRMEPVEGESFCLLLSPLTFQIQFLVNEETKLRDSREGAIAAHHLVRAMHCFLHVPVHGRRSVNRSDSEQVHPEGS